MSANDDMVQGYLDGGAPDALPPGPNRSQSYRHGWENARNDRAGAPRATAARLRVEAAAAIAADGIEREAGA